MWTQIQAVHALTKARIQALREDPDAGYATETVVIAAILAALALLAVGVIIWNAVVDKANSIEL